MIRYIFIGIAFYISFLFITLPANTVYAYWKEYLADEIPVTLTGLEGSIWSGRANSATLFEQKVQPLEWSFHPLSLLLGKLEVQWTLSVPDGQANGTSGMSLFNGFFLEDVDAQLPAKVIGSFANVEALNPAGTVIINMRDFASDGQNITRANGTISWRNAAVTLFQPMELGNYEVEISQDGDIINGVLKDKGGPIEANGQLSLTVEGDYEFNGVLAVRDTGRQDLRQGLQSLGKPDRDGKIKIFRKGNLSQLSLGT